jgi:RNA polymerase sigma-70 factor (ECF subfamily)
VLEDTAPAPDADARLDAAALRAELETALEDLAPAVRVAVVLRVVEQLDYDELAARLGCSSQAARLRVSRGLRALRRTTSLSPILEGAPA